VQPDAAEHGPDKIAQREVSMTPTGRIEIEFSGGVRLRTEGTVDADTLCAVIRELSRS
jgi:hypothetical protein